jgi:hypothetical protein
MKPSASGGANYRSIGKMVNWREASYSHSMVAGGLDEIS